MRENEGREMKMLSSSQQQRVAHHSPGDSEGRGGYDESRPLLSVAQGNAEGLNQQVGQSALVGKDIGTSVWQAKQRKDHLYSFA